MKAATAYNVIQALPKEELPMLYKMLGINISTEKEIIKPLKKEKLLSKASAEDYLRATVFNVRKSHK
ncbi:hypothetical protein H2O64_02765 [Kordia sp. YSTF-M3]|uniref:Uncharacterized protein n=1 Tax=Kordia aestuariivivens TaxID=2759037 RepID=A0ABR7Q4X9_9FLAO|nr:hypothetical protein [Kordia aestuariivivens]MBC8753577.1 hypothetical protein [Kordia aestuariivivens]